MIGTSLSKLQYSQKWYVHHVHKKIIERKWFAPHCLLESYVWLFTEIYWKRMVSPHCCWMVCMSRSRIFTKENGLPHTVAKWYVRLIHGNSWKKTVCPTLLLNGTYVWFMEIHKRKRFAPHCCWKTNNIIIQLPKNKLTTMLINYKKKLYTIQLSQQLMKSWEVTVFTLQGPIP